MNIVYQTQNSNVPSISTQATALASNPARLAWSIQNLGTNALFVKLGDSASTSSFHVVLKAGTGADDGLGGSLAQEAGAVYTGIVTVAGTSPRYTVTELAP